MIGPINKTTKRYNSRGLLKEVYVVTEWKDGCIYRTRSVGFVIADSSHNPVSPRGTVGSISTKYSMALLGVK